MTMESDTKFEGKLTCGLDNDMRNLVHFHQNTWKFQSWNFDGIFYPKSKRHELKITVELCVMTLKNDKKYEVELTCRIKIDIRNFDGILLLKQKMC